MKGIIHKEATIFVIAHHCDMTSSTVYVTQLFIYMKCIHVIFVSLSFFTVGGCMPHCHVFTVLPRLRPVLLVHGKISERKDLHGEVTKSKSYKDKIYCRRKERSAIWGQFVFLLVQQSWNLSVQSRVIITVQGVPNH